MDGDDVLKRALSDIVEEVGVTTTQGFDDEGPEIPEFEEGTRPVHHVSRAYVEWLAGVHPEDSSDEEEMEELQFLGISPLIWQAAKTIVRVGRRMWKRHEGDLTWHGFRETLVEELIREVWALDKLGKRIWARMKTNAEAAYADGAAGSYLVSHLTRWLDVDPDRRLTIVGHSAGSFHAGYMIDRLVATSEREHPVHRLIFMAPACDLEFFDRHVAANVQAVERFRMFTMDKEHERLDKLFSPLYQRSLLFLVSGILEERAAWPILGMARWTHALPAPSKTFVEAQEHGIVHSPGGGGADGLRTTSTAHGDFDNDDPTLESVFFLLRRPPADATQ